MPADGFFEGPFATGIAHDELLPSIILPAPRDDAGSARVSLEQPASRYATVGVAEVLATAASQAVSGRPVNSDNDSGSEYRSAMATVYTRRALEAALARAG